MTYRIRICNLAPETGEGRDRFGKLWRWEFGEHVGPLFVRRNGDPLKNQPMAEDHPAWDPFNDWLKQRNSKTAGDPK